MLCDCATFDDLELLREQITTRARSANVLKSRLDLLAEHPEGEHSLYKCPVCDQYWQRSLAWNWGNKEYHFRVPRIDAENWKSKPFVAPDELLIFSAVASDYLNRPVVESERVCNQADCDRRAIQFSIFCRKHHIEMLQSIGRFPPSPVGRWFGPYVEVNFVIPPG